jgi:hypothetical protein
MKAEYDIPKKDSKLKVLGNEYFHQMKIATDSLQEQFDGRIHNAEIPQNFSADWIDIGGTATIKGDKKDTMSIAWVMTSRQPWYRASLQIEVDTLEISNVISDLAFTHKDNRITFTWFANPPETLHIAAKFIVEPGAKMIRKGTGIYPFMPMPIAVSSDLADVIYRTEVVYSDTLEIK